MPRRRSRRAPRLTPSAPVPRWREERAWHALEPAEAVRLLESSGERGLGEADAARRLAAAGPNELREERRFSPVSILLRQVTSPLIYILIIAGIVSLAVQEYIDAAIVAAVILVDGVIGFFQEYRAEQSVAALRRLSVARARAVRDGREREIDSRELVPGDVVSVEAGARVPADARLISAHALEADESLLTGESAPVSKTIAAVDADAPVADRTSILHMGTIITRGRGRAVVVATGASTEIGAIAGSLSEITELQSPVQRRMAQFARIVALAVLVVFCVGLAAGLARGESLDELFLTLVALAVSAIPEGLPVVLTVTLAVGVRRMAARHVIIRRLPAVETLGSCTVIGSDKTGTLTQNRMTVERVYAGGELFAVSGTGYGTQGSISPVREGAVAAQAQEALRLTLIAGALNNTAIAVPADGSFEVSGDPTEIALIVAAHKLGLDRDVLEDEWPLEAEIPFDPERLYSATFHRTGDGQVVFVKGAAERVLGMCASSFGAAFDAAEALRHADAMARDGLRILAFAFGGDAVARRFVVDHEMRELTFLGLQGMIDPLRDEALAAVAGCRAAGIRVLMITGDHPVTATAIGRELGLVPADALAISGEELAALSPGAFRDTIGAHNAFARVSPGQKLRIVQALQAAGETVAVTGDGVNDAPALRAAEIGVAMGATGTDVAREASDMIVTDDNFASVFAAVEEGRLVFENVRKVTFFLISSGAAEVIAVLSSLFFGFRAPFLPGQLLWLNLVTSGVQDVALAFEPPDPDVLERPPRPKREGVMSRLLWERTALVGMVMAAGTLALFLLELHLGSGIEQARTVALTTMVLFQVFHVGNCRSERLSAFQKSPFSNRFLFLGTAAAMGIQVAALYLPFTQYILRLEPLSLAEWARMVPVAASVILAVEADKWVRRRAAARVRRGVAGTDFAHTRC